MFKIDWKKWKRALDGAKAADDAADQTLLYSIRAMARGRVHRCRARLDWYTLRTWGKITPEQGTALHLHGGGHQVVVLTLEDQARFVGEAWRQFERAAPAAAA